MGYYTTYSINLVPDKGYEEEEQQFADALIKESGNHHDVADLVNDGVVFAKLYELDSYISAVAVRFPHVLVCLSGDGESSDDLWEKRWKGNEWECQNAIIPPFTNASLLTESELTNRTIIL